MSENDGVKDLDKWKKIISSESDKQLDTDIKSIPREVVMELARDPVLGPKISNAINRAMGQRGPSSGEEDVHKSAGASAAAAAIKARQEKIAKEEKDEQERKLSLVARIQRMDIGAKAKLAREGDQAARAILIKEGSKVVSLAVLANPKITIQEIEMISASRNVSEEVLREIAGNRDWVKGYTVILALVNNPKTPISLTLPFLPRLLTRDLRFLAKSKGVPEVIRMSARKLAQKRQI
jgi:hypothetical protein